MGTISKNTVVTSATSTTGTLKRTVSDYIRRFSPVVAPVMSMVKTQGISEMGDPSYSKGMIDKKGTPTMKFEWFTSTPPAMYYTATGGSSTTAVISSNTGFITRDIIVNLTTLQVAIVNTLTNSDTLTVTAIGGTWSCSAGDVIAMCNNAQEEGSSTAVSRTSEPDNNFNYCQIFRFPVSIADTARNSPHYAEDLVSRYKKDNMYFALKNMENSIWLGKKATSETTSVTIDGTALSVYSSRGIMDMSQVTYDCQGTMTYDLFNNDLYQSLPNTLDPDDELVMYCGRKIQANMNNWVQQKLMITESEKDVFGSMATRFLCGNFKVRPIVHDLFDKGALANQFVILRTKDLVYRFKEGLDLQVKTDIQNPAAMAKTDELRGVFGLQIISGGAEVIRGINWN